MFYSTDFCNIMCVNILVLLLFKLYFYIVKDDRLNILTYEYVLIDNQLNKTEQRN